MFKKISKLNLKIEIIVYPFILAVVVIFLFSGITKLFYQQDEWLGYGLYLAEGESFIFHNTRNIFSLILGEGRVFYSFLLYFFYHFWPLNAVPIALFSLILHSLNTVLVFLLARKLLKNPLPSFLGALFFAVSSVSQSAVTWGAASLNTLPSTTLILIAVFLYFKYLEIFKEKWIVLSFIAIYLSLFFKESGIFLFLIFPFFSLFYKRENVYSFLKKYWYFFLIGSLIVFYRVLELKFAEKDVALFLTGSSKYYFDSLVVRAVFYPLTSFSLSIIPPEPFLNFARYITNVYYPFFPAGQFILIAQTVVLDLLALSLSALILFLFIFVLKITEKKLAMKIKFWIIFLIMSFLPYLIISKSYAYLESRYYYLASVAWAVIFGWLLTLLIKKVGFFWKVIAIFAFGVFLLYHWRFVKSDIKKASLESQTRIQIINQIKDLKPKLEKEKNVFYVTGDTDYFLPGNKVPFQQGFGYTLMSLYFNSGKIPQKLLSESYLFEIGSQGYKEVEKIGFGYFSDKNFFEEFTASKIKSVEIIHLDYDSKKGIVRINP